MAEPDEGMIRQRLADFETLRQVTELGGLFLGQHPGPPMSHAGQDGIRVRAGFGIVLPRMFYVARRDAGQTHGPYGGVACPGVALAKTGGWRVTFQ